MKCRDKRAKYFVDGQKANQAKSLKLKQSRKCKRKLLLSADALEFWPWKVLADGRVKITVSE